MTSSNLHISRRHFLLTSGLLLLSVRGVSGQDSGIRVSFFIDESGNPGTDTPFVIGALLTSNPDKHLRNFSEIRNQNSYRLPLRYASNDCHKLPYARGLLEYFFGQTDLRFAAYAFTSVKNIDWPNDPVIGEIRYHDVYHKLVIENVRRDQNLVITLKLRTTTGEDKHLHSYLHKELRRLVAIRVVRGYENDLTQFADLLVGCIYGDMLRPESHIKLNLIRELKARLSVQSLWDKSLSKRGGFRVTVVDR